MKEPALVIVDMLNDFLERWAPPSKQKLIRSINDLVHIVRSYDRPVIWVRQEFQPDLRDAFLEVRARRIPVTIQGTPGCQIASDLAVDPSDTMLIKKRYSAFYGTTLDQTLADLRPSGLILAGINTHSCIRMTAIDAYQRDWQVILAADCVDSYDRELILRSLAHRGVSKDELVRILAQLRPRIGTEAITAG